MSAREALLNFSEKQLRADKRKRKNKKPEKDVQIECVQWFNSQGIDGNIIEAKGGYRNEHGVVAVMPGYPDWSGNNDQGRAMYVEFKAKGRLSTLRENQRRFLERKIAQNCFAICVDNVELLRNSYSIWLGLVTDSHFVRAQAFLRDLLPKKKKEKDSPLF